MAPTLVRRMSAPACQFLLTGRVTPSSACVVYEVVALTFWRSASIVLLPSRSFSRVARFGASGSWKNRALPSISMGVLRRS